LNSRWFRAATALLLKLVAIAMPCTKRLHCRAFPGLAAAGVKADDIAFASAAGAPCGRRFDADPRNAEMARSATMLAGAADAAERRRRGAGTIQRTQTIYPRLVSTVDNK
jgi:hypothetical protein